MIYFKNLLWHICYIGEKDKKLIGKHSNFLFPLEITRNIFIKKKYKNSQYFLVYDTYLSHNCHMEMKVKKLFSTVLFGSFLAWSNFLILLATYSLFI